MKKFTKLFLSCAAVAAITASIATAAMAEGEISLTGDVAGTYNPTDGKLAITAPADIDDGTQATLLVYAAGKDRTEVKGEDVSGVDQTGVVNKTTTFANNGLKGKPQVPTDAEKEQGIKNRKYTVALGYYAGGKFTVKEGTLLLGEEDGLPIILGDVNGDTTVNSSDAMAILFSEVGVTARAEKAGKALTIVSGAPEGFPKATLHGDVNGDTTVNSSDAMAILFNEVGVTARAEQAGKTVTGTLAE